jgi:hypothetical protein
LHSQRNALDSGYLFDVTQSYANGRQPLRFLAEGRDPSATLDSGFSGMPGYQNEGDNEITGIHVSDGDAGINGILGTKAVHGRLASVLHPAARRQSNLGDHPGAALTSAGCGGVAVSGRPRR